MPFFTAIKINEIKSRLKKGGKIIWYLVILASQYAVINEIISSECHRSSYQKEWTKAQRHVSIDNNLIWRARRGDALIEMSFVIPNRSLNDKTVIRNKLCINCLGSGNCLSFETGHLVKLSGLNFSINTKKLKMRKSNSIKQ